MKPPTSSSGAPGSSAIPRRRSLSRASISLARIASNSTGYCRNHRTATGTDPGAGQPDPDERDDRSLASSGDTHQPEDGLSSPAREFRLNCPFAAGSSKSAGRLSARPVGQNCKSGGPGRLKSERYRRPTPKHERPGVCASRPLVAALQPAMGPATVPASAATPYLAPSSKNLL